MFVIANVLDFGKARALLAGWTIGILFLVAIIRVATYALGYLPPISLWGRIRTFRWIIPGYDAIFVPSLLSLALLSSLKWLILDYRLPIEFVLPIVTATTVFVLLGCPPGLDEWRLTGNHRIVAAIPKQQMQQLP